MATTAFCPPYHKKEYSWNGEDMAGGGVPTPVGLRNYSRTVEFKLNSYYKAS